jgi:hypothetical protein
MKFSSYRSIAAGVVLSSILALALAQQARSQISASPTLTPIGVSSSGTSSTAWFHDKSAGQTVACRTVEAKDSGLSGIQCVAARLP